MYSMDEIEALEKINATLKEVVKIGKIAMYFKYGEAFEKEFKK